MRSDKRKRSAKNYDCENDEIVKKPFEVDHSFSWDLKKNVVR